MAYENVNSVLVADIGSVHTRLLLVDLVEGQYRLVASSHASTTAEPPLNSVSLGLEHAAQHLSEMIGRRLISGEPQQLFVMPEAQGHGVDEFLATGSAGRPMRVLLVGLTPEISLASGRRALSGSYVTITDVLSPDDLRSEEEQINAILHGDPDLIVIVGGTDDGAETVLLDLVARVQMALSLVTFGRAPAVLFAGNHRLRAPVKSLLDPYTDVFFAQNVRPALDDEQLFPAQLELALVYDDYRSGSLSGFAEVGRQSQVGVVPTTQGYIGSLRYLGSLPRRRGAAGPLLVDVGSANSVMVANRGDEPSYTIRTDLGIGHHMVSALEAITPDRLRQWLPFNISEAALWDYAHNKALRPGTIPGTAEDLLIEQAFAREIARRLVEDASHEWGVSPGQPLPPFDPIIGAGAILTEAPHPGVAAMLLLDALQPEGLVDLQLDPHNLLSAAGVVAYLNPLITVQMLESGGLLRLGAAFSPSGRVREGRAAMRVQIQPESGPTITHVVRGGEIWTAPLLPGVAARVTVKLRRGLSIGGRRRLRQRVIAGAAGIIFDARGRPLSLPRARDRAARYAAWQRAVTGRDDASPLPGAPERAAATSALAVSEEQEAHAVPS